MARDGGRGQAAVLLDANDLPSRLAYKRCPALDPNYPVVLGQLGHAGALLLAELYGFHLLSSLVALSTAPLRELGPRVRLCRDQVRARSRTAMSSTAPKRSGSAPLRTASNGRRVWRASPKAQRAV